MEVDGCKCAPKNFSVCGYTDLNYSTSTSLQTRIRDEELNESEHNLPGKNRFRTSWMVNVDAL